jgi:hypothetical protein
MADGVGHKKLYRAPRLRQGFFRRIATVSRSAWQRLSGCFLFAIAARFHWLSSGIAPAACIAAGNVFLLL